MTATAGPLLDQLTREAAAAVAERAALGRAEADRIHDAAAAQRARRRATVVGERERALALEGEAERARIAQSTVRDVLTAREAFLARVFAEAERRLNAVAVAPDLAARLTPLLVEGLPFLDPADRHARCAAGLRQAVRDALIAAGHTEIEIETDEAVPTGAMLENATGTVRVDVTLTARLRRMRAMLAIVAVKAVEEMTP